MVEIYRIDKGAEAWKYKAYDYVRTDAFCVGQGIPIELEFSHDEKEEELQAVLLVEDHKPVAGCRIAFPDEKTGKIERVCVVREKRLEEDGVNHIVISSQDRAAGFYEKLGYKLNPDVSPDMYDRHHEDEGKKQEAKSQPGKPRKPIPGLGFTCVLVEKYL